MIDYISKIETNVVLIFRCAFICILYKTSIKSTSDIDMLQKSSLPLFFGLDDTRGNIGRRG